MHVPAVLPRHGRSHGRKLPHRSLRREVRGPSHRPRDVAFAPPDLTDGASQTQETAKYSGQQCRDQKGETNEISDTQRETDAEGHYGYGREDR